MTSVPKTLLHIQCCSHEGYKSEDSRVAPNQEVQYGQVAEECKEDLYKVAELLKMSWSETL